MPNSASPDGLRPGVVDRRRVIPADDPALADVLATIGLGPGHHELDDPARIEQDRAALLKAGLTVGVVGDGTWSGEVLTPPRLALPGWFVTIHGGGYATGSVDTYRHRYAQMAMLAECRVLNVEYRLAPAHAFPAALDDCVAAVAWAAERGPAVVGGDSAGAALAIATALVRRDHGDTLPAGIVALNPWVDLTCTLPSLVERRARDPFSGWGAAKNQAEAYLAGTPATHPLASPLYADFAGLPDMLIQIGTEDVLFDEAIGLADRAAAGGVRVRLEEWEGMFHKWHGYAGRLRGADEAIESIATFVRGRLGADAGQ